MDLAKILAQLRQEREQIEESIVSLERLAGGRRGRPPAWVHKRRGPPSVRSGSGSVGGSGGAGTPLPSHPRPHLADCPTRRRCTLINPDLKS